jgi:hypothetical protein
MRRCDSSSLLLYDVCEVCRKSCQTKILNLYATIMQYIIRKEITRRSYATTYHAKKTIFKQKFGDNSKN